MEAKYDKIGLNYNLTRQADKYLTEQLFLLLNPNTKGHYLDIGCGTGNYSIKLRERGLQFMGIDPSTAMLKLARSKTQEIEWKLGTAENTGLSDESIDGIIAILTIHHWEDIMDGFSELFRILKPNGRIVIFTSTPIQMKKYWLNHYFPKMLTDSIIQMPSFSNTVTAMERAGFDIIGKQIYSVRPDLDDHFLYCGKHNPAIYLHEKIRHGISSFSSLANKEEVKLGLSKLKNDIDEGKIDKIIESFENDLGDYLFITGNKPLRESNQANILINL